MEYEYYMDLIAASTTFDRSQVSEALEFELKFWMQSQPNLAYSYAD